jgi:hypothetical protein
LGNEYKVLRLVNHKKGRNISVSPFFVRVCYFLSKCLVEIWQTAQLV